MLTGWQRQVKCGVRPYICYFENVEKIELQPHRVREMWFRELQRVSYAKMRSIRDFDLLQTFAPHSIEQDSRTHYLGNTFQLLSQKHTPNPAASFWCWVQIYGPHGLRLSQWVSRVYT
jgi:hypothetical protein